MTEAPGKAGKTNGQYLIPIELKRRIKKAAADLDCHPAHVVIAAAEAFLSMPPSKRRKLVAPWAPWSD